MTLSDVTKLKSYLLIVVWCGMSNLGYGQLEGQLKKEDNLKHFPFTVTQYNAQDGLNQNQVDDILMLAESRSILCATANGLSEFDGYAFKPFPLEINHPRMMYLRRLYQPFGEKTLYAQFPTGSARHLMMKEKETGMYPGFHFFAVHFSQEYISYVDTTNCFIRISKTGDTLFSREIETEDPISFILPIDEEQLLFSNNRGLFVADLREQGRIRQLGPQRILFEKKHPTREMTYLAGGNGIWEIDSTLQPAPLDFGGVRLTGITDMAFVQGLVFITTLNGLYKMEVREDLPSKITEMLPSQRLYSCLFDSLSGVLFVGTADQGLLKLQPRNAYSLKIDEERLRESFSSIVPVSEDEIWTVSSGELFSINTTGQQLMTSRQIFFYPVSSLSILDDKAYVGSWNRFITEVHLKDPSVSRKIAKYKNVVLGIYRDKQNVIWAGSDKGIMRGPSIDELTPFMPETFSVPVITFMESSTGELWLGGQRTLVRLDNDRKILNLWGEPDGLTGNDVRSFFEDTKGNIWIGTYESGLFVYTNGRLVNVSAKRNCMLGNDIFTLAPDKFGNLLISSNHGIRKVEIKALQDFLMGRKDYLVPFFFDEHSGIYNTEFNGGFFNNYYSSDQETFYFPTIQGVVQFISGPDNRRDSPVRLTSIILDGRVQSEIPTTIGREFREIFFEFQSNHFTLSNNVYYQYRLGKNGKPGTWSNLTKSTSLRITNPGAGNYLLEVRAIDGFNERNPDSFRYSFSVPHFFYEYQSFWILMVTIASFFIYFFWRLRFKRKKRQLRQEFQMQQTIKELQLQAVQARMNPHFIFNALNVVNLMIMKGEREKVGKYLEDFSDLLKQYLAQSQEHFCSLKKEMELLKAYLEIQRIRMEDKLEFEVTYPENSGEILIPTMILQPLVENAVVHGIAHKKEKGHVRIQAFQESGKVIIEIEDDGIGRVEAGKLRMMSKRSSFGISLVNKKKELLEDQFGISTTISIVDLEPETGTRVIITFSVRPVRTHLSRQLRNP